MPSKPPLHYHVILLDGEHPPATHVETFAEWSDAENRAFALAEAAEDWAPTRYPGRPARRGELTAYLDRHVMDRHALRREISVVRCDGDDDCPSRGRVPEPGSSGGGSS